MIRKTILLSACVLALASCSTTKPLYSWYNYENITYQYSKKGTDELRLELLEQYQKMCDLQKGSRLVPPPGMFAEYGYLLYKTGKEDEGLEFMKKEIDLYPESETYISRIIKQLEQ